MVKKFKFFGMHQYAIYTAEACVAATIGTRNLGPCIAFFLYNPETQSCLAMHMDALTSLQAVKTAMREFLPEYLGIEKCRAFLVGGWPSAIAEGDRKALELPEFLRELKVASLESQLLVFNGKAGELDSKYFFDTVTLNLHTGSLLVLRNSKHDFQPADETNQAEKDLYQDCMLYMLYGGSYELSDSVAKMLNGKPFDSLRAEVREVYQAIIDKNNGTPLIPVRNILAIASGQLEALALQASKGDALEVLKLLYANFVNPVASVAGKLGNTPLHYACSALNKQLANYNLQAIVLLLILHGKRDKPNDAGNLALNKLQDPALRDFKSLCLKLMSHLNRYKELPAINGRILLVYRIVMAVVVDDVLEYAATASLAKKQEIEHRLIDFVQMVTNVNVPTSPAAAAAGMRLR